MNCEKVGNMAVMRVDTGTNLDLNAQQFKHLREDVNMDSYVH